MKNLTQLIKNAYLSFDSALSYHGIIDQCIFDLKFASLYNSFDIRTINKRVIGIVIPEDLFFGYNINLDCNIAKPEKALLDQIWYIEDTGQIFNPEDIDWNVLDKLLLDKYAEEMGIDYKKYLNINNNSNHHKEAYRLNRIRSFIHSS